MSQRINTSEFPHLIRKFPRLEVWDSIARSNQQRLNLMFHRYGVTEGISLPIRQAREVLDASVEVLSSLKMTPPFQFEMKMKGRDARGLPLVPIADKYAGFLLHEHPGFEYNVMSAIAKDIVVFNTRNCDGAYNIGNAGLGFSNADDAVTKFMSISFSYQVSDRVPAHLMSKRNFPQRNSPLTGESLTLDSALNSMGGEFLIIGESRASLHVFHEVRNPNNPLADTIIRHRCAIINLDTFTKEPVNWISSTDFGSIFTDTIMTPQGSVKNPLFTGPLTLMDIKKAVTKLREVGWIRDTTRVALNFGW